MDRHLLVALAAAAALASVPGRAAAQDTTPPGTITDFAMRWVDGLDYDGDGFPDYYTADLTWTSPGDDGFVAGTSVTTYEFRGLDSPISAGNWANTSTLDPGASFAILPAPQAATAHMIYSWIPGTVYYFAIRAIDDNSNSAPIVQTVSTAPVAPESSKGGKGCAKSAGGSMALLALLLPLPFLRR